MPFVLLFLAVYGIGNAIYEIATGNEHTSQGGSGVGGDLEIF